MCWVYHNLLDETCRFVPQKQDHPIHVFHTQSSNGSCSWKPPKFVASHGN